VTPHDEAEVRVFNILRGEAEEVRHTAFGSVGTLFSGRGIECVWVSKLDEQVDPDWFSSDDVDVMLVVQGRLRVEFEPSSLADRELKTGDLLVLPAGVRCRAYRWPRDSETAAVFLAIYPLSEVPDERPSS
jgi:hypothetical protein